MAPASNLPCTPIQGFAISDGAWLMFDGVLEKSPRIEDGGFSRATEYVLGFLSGLLKYSCGNVLKH